ncbi:hypothetical protein PG988_001929 [Apiospora saccharicola]
MSNPAPNCCDRVTRRDKYDFLFHVPDLRSHWKTKYGWKFCDLYRLNLLQDENTDLSRYLHQKQDLQKLLMISSSKTPDEQQFLHLKQRYLCPEQDYVLQQQEHVPYAGTYYIFCSNAVDDLPQNHFVPGWLQYTRSYWGDVFIVKMASQDFDENGWAVYEDISSLFLGVLDKGALYRHMPGVLET